MDERFLVIITLVIFFASLVSVFLFFRCPRITSDLMINHLGNCVLMCGHVVSRYETDDGCFYTIIDEAGSFRAVHFKSGCVDGYVCFEGRINIWRGEYELVVLRRA